MSYPTGTPGGYSSQPTQQSAPVFGRPPQRPNPLGDLGLSRLLYLLVAVLSLVAYFCSFTSDASGLSLQVMILLGGGLLAALDLLPKGPDTLVFSTLLSTIGGLGVLAAVIEGSGGTVPTIDIIILVFALLQFLVSVAALLMDHEIVKLAPRQAVPYQPAPSPNATTTFQPAGQPGGPHTGAQQQGGPAHPGQPAPGGQQPAPGQTPGQPGAQQPGQPGQYGQPPAQSTQFMQQPGQLGNPSGFNNGQQ